MHQKIKTKHLELPSSSYLFKIQHEVTVIGLFRLNHKDTDAVVF